jgi:hypothetical protein
MKYLKIFESFGEYYSEISSHAYSILGDNVEEMSENDFFKIKYKIKSKDWKVFSYQDTEGKQIAPTKDFKNICKIIFDKEDEFFYRKVIITKMSDEWYYIFLRENPWGGNTVKNKYYKADQLEGLEKFIDEVL